MDTKEVEFGLRGSTGVRVNASHEVPVYDFREAKNSRTPMRVVRIRTDDWPEPDRVAMFREMHGRDRIRIEPTRNEPLRIDAKIMRFPELALLWGHRSPLRSEFSDGNDRLVLSLAGPALATQFGREIALEQGDAIALCGSDRATLTTLRSGRIMTLEFPQGALLPLLKHRQQACARRIPVETMSLRLLRGYVEAAQTTDSIDASGLPGLVIAHLYDLAAMAVGSAREAEEIATGRGVRAARLRAIKSDILSNLERDVALDALAARHRVSARYIRMLFESEGTSVTGFVRDERLKRARTMLLSPRFAGRKIAEVAYTVGFNDLSYFNRAFRRQFGQTPGEARAMR